MPKQFLESSSSDLENRLIDRFKRHVETKPKDLSNRSVSWAKIHDNKDLQKNTIDNLKKHLVSAKEFYEKLSDYVFERTANICVTGKDTVMNVTWNNDDKKFESNTANDGDGTVPLDSQSMGWVLDYSKHVKETQRSKTGGCVRSWRVFTNGIDHADVFKDEANKAGIFDQIFGYMEEMYELWQSLDTESSSAPSEGSVQSLDVSSS
jgi:hypothetical protein